MSSSRNCYHPGQVALDTTHPRVTALSRASWNSIRVSNLASALAVFSLPSHETIYCFSTCGEATSSQTFATFRAYFCCWFAVASCADGSAGPGSWNRTSPVPLLASLEHSSSSGAAQVRTHRTYLDQRKVGLDGYGSVTSEPRRGLNFPMMWDRSTEGVHARLDVTRKVRVYGRESQPSHAQMF